MELYVNNSQDKILVDKNFHKTLKEIIMFTLNKEEISDFELGVTLVDSHAIRELNRMYRGIDETTDVLSFPLTEASEDACITGDIVISLETAVSQAEEYGHSLLREVSYLAVHGIYHILGYTHNDESSQQKMREKEESILKHFDLSR